MRSFETTLRQPNDEIADVDEAVRDLFEALLARPVPERLLSLMDRLERQTEAA